jgi:capsular polysaccharide biosynthesis protein
MEQQMSENNKSDRIQASNSDDEIELIDLLRVIWRWKYLIIFGTAFFVIIAAVISYNSPKIYQVQTVLKPGILKLTDDGKEIYIDTPENIIGMIESGAFNNKILRLFNEAQDTSISFPKRINLRVSTPNKSNAIVVVYQTSNIELGKTILKHLIMSLENEYSRTVKLHINKIENEINLKNDRLKYLKKMERLNEAAVNRIDTHIEDLQKELQTINKNIELLMQYENGPSDNRNKAKYFNNTLSYLGALQNNISIINSVKWNIDRTESRREDILSKINNIENETQELLAQIANLKIQRDSVKSIEVVQLPYSNNLPLKPKPKVNMSLAFIAGVLMFVILSFFLEYIIRRKNFKEENNL